MATVKKSTTSGLASATVKQQQLNAYLDQQRAAKKALADATKTNNFVDLNSGSNNINKGFQPEPWTPPDGKPPIDTSTSSSNPFLSYNYNTNQWEFNMKGAVNANNPPPKTLTGSGAPAPPDPNLPPDFRTGSGKLDLNKMLSWVIENPTEARKAGYYAQDILSALQNEQNVAQEKADDTFAYWEARLRDEFNDAQIKNEQERMRLQQEQDALNRQMEWDIAQMNFEAAAADRAQQKELAMQQAMLAQRGQFVTFLNNLLANPLTLAAFTRSGIGSAPGLIQQFDLKAKQGEQNSLYDMLNPVIESAGTLAGLSAPPPRPDYLTYRR